MRLGLDIRKTNGANLLDSIMKHCFAIDAKVNSRGVGLRLGARNEENVHRREPGHGELWRPVE